MWAVGEGSAWLGAIGGHAHERPGAPAIVEVSPSGETSHSWTWRDLARHIRHRADAIRHHARPGDTVVAALPSGVDLAAWFGGSVLAGVRLALMHPRSGPGEFARVCGQTRAGAVLAGDELVGRLQGSAARITIPEPDQRLDPSALEPLPPGASAGSIILGSSGTTGLPKLVVRGSEALDADARAVAEGLELTPSDRVLCVVPLCHSYGVDLLLGTLFAGATLVVMSEFDPDGAAAQIASGVTVLPGVPFVFEALSRRTRPPEVRLRLAVSAGSMLSRRVREEFTGVWGIQVGQLYGATELGTVAVGTPGHPEFDPHSIGRLLSGVSIRVLDLEDATREVPCGTQGQIAVRAPSMLSGYIDADLDLVDGHLLTGDLGRRDHDGRVMITGRLKLLIDSGGFKVNPMEVEAALSEHPGVAECAVVPLPLSDTIQRLFAFVVPKDVHTPPVEKELRGFLRERLAPTKIPRGFGMVASLPRSPLGKLLRDRLPRMGVETGP
jgi:acyl-CoA synthetase (AMP-forming)/AMP-acid ligase II